MRTSWPAVVALALLAPLGLHVPASHAQNSAQNARVIVKFKPGVGLPRTSIAAAAPDAAVRRAHALSSRIGVALSDGRTVGPRSQVVHGRGMTSADLAALLSRDPDVEYAVVDQRRRVQMLPNDPLYPGGLSGVTPASGQWYLRSPDTTAVSAINAQSAWDRVTGAGVVVAVLDTGVRLNHPDLATKFVPGYDFIHDVATANDGNAADSDPSDPGDWITTDESDTQGGPFEGCGFENSSWHGTQVSGLIGAMANNGVGIAGVGGDVKILPARVLGKCGGYDSDIVAAMRWAAGIAVPGVPANANKARVINMSLGSSSACSLAYTDAINAVNAEGVVVVISAGNDGLAVSSPANCPGAIAVGGLRHIGTKVGYSNLGPQVTISAPAGNCVNDAGVCLYPLLTTTNSGVTAPVSNAYSDGFNFSVGTSFSAPLVAGTAALLISADPTLTPAQVRSHLMASARPFPTTGAGIEVQACVAPSGGAQDECYCTASTCGAGMLDAAAAVQRVVPTARLVPVISFTATNATPTSPFTLDSSQSLIPGGHNATILWTVVTGPATIASANNASAVTLQPSGSGDVVVTLALTDTTTMQTVERQLTVRLGVVSAAAPPADSGGGGGGALGLVWLAGLALAVMALQLQRNRNCPSKVSRRRQ